MKIKLNSYKLLFRLLDLLSNSKWLHKLVINKKIYMGASIISLSLMGNSCTSDKVESKETEEKKDSTVDNLNGNDIPKSKKDSISRKTIKSKNEESIIDIEVTCYKTTINSEIQDNSPVVSVKNDTFEDSTCYIIIESEPEFKGGNDSLLKYLSSNIYRPEGTEQISGTVYIGFTVEADGKISNIHIRKSLHPLLDTEVIRVITAMPDWVWPDYSKKREKTNFTIPIKFLAE